MSTPDFGIVHKAGCDAPGIAAAMPFATLAGRGVIDTVADGKGGELFRCRRCGVVEGQTPAAGLDVPQAAPGGATARGPDPADTVTREQVEQARESLRREGRPYGYKALAHEFGISVSTVRRRLGVL